MDNEIEVTNLCKKIFEIEAINVDTKFIDMPEWDSLRYAELIIEVEEVFSVQMEIAEMQTVDSVKSLIVIINSHKNNRLNLASAEDFSD